jgi:hypothetical protein
MTAWIVDTGSINSRESNDPISTTFCENGFRVAWTIGIFVPTFHSPIRAVSCSVGPNGLTIPPPNNGTAPRAKMSNVTGVGLENNASVLTRD